MTSERGLFSTYLLKDPCLNCAPRVYSYLGLIDDFARNHGDASITSLPVLNDQLLTAALFEGALLVNDGYLLNHPVLQQALIDPECSPFSRLVESGFIKIVTRNDRQLGTLADQMADDGILSAQKLLDQRDYKGALKPALERWTERLEVGDPQSSFRSWPRAHVSQLFAILALQALDRAIELTSKGVTEKEVKEFRKAFKAAGPAANRTEWERLADRRRDQDLLTEPVHHSLMLIANEAYQYAWGCALSEGGEKTSVLTRAPHYLDLDRSVGELDESRIGETFSVYGPNIRVAGKRVGKNWELLAELVRRGAPATYLKAQYVEALERYYAGDGEGTEEVDRARDEYSKVLSEQFGSRRRAFTFGVASTVATTAIGAVVAGPVAVGIGVGLGLGLLTNVSDNTFGPKLISRASAKVSKPWITKKRERPLPVISSFQLDPPKAEALLGRVERFAT